MATTVVSAVGATTCPRSPGPSCQTRRMRLGRTLAVLLATMTIAAGCGADGDADSPASTTVAPAESTVTAPGSDTGSAEDADVAHSPVDQWPTPLDELDPDAPARWTVEVLDRLPHDPAAFTQGLEQLADGTLLESTGLRGESTIRRVDPATGAVLDIAELDDLEFGEGATVSDDTVVQLTWKAEVARRWDLATFEPLPAWEYAGEGWGLCLLSDRFAMTDGSATLTYRDVTDFSVLDRVTVTLEGTEVVRLNELECVDGHVIANIWLDSTIVVIRPDGRVVATIDATPLVAEAVPIDDLGARSPDVLNGIAVRDDSSLWLTGKLWPTLFAVRVVPVA